MSGRFEVEGHHGPAAFGDRLLPTGPPVAALMLWVADQQESGQRRADTPLQ
ncbi:hypothetical protein E4N62_16020 [Streptomyces sp. MNU76]|uniref:hypothetical protein n=1 Tax=Streptomyces sp. MNU76 TaxID=2560026 RepID=UPI001E311AA4|nr:hypothetical protein [Streptomyces sp. MNU76]MCC9706643.1 hypothetical protein [Streptomyces sp. MNU76]